MLAATDRALFTVEIFLTPPRTYWSELSRAKQEAKAVAVERFIFIDRFTGLGLRISLKRDMR